jgi:uncharacterized protein YfdQ (DUF2303 family)
MTMIRDALEYLVRLGETTCIQGPDTHITRYIGPDGEIQTYDDINLAAGPRRRTGVVTAQTSEAFAAYLDRHATPATEVWADVTGTVVAVINAGEAAGDASPGTPGWGDHRCKLDLVPSTAWQAWTAWTGKMRRQADFAEHIEDRVADIIDPTAAEMLELAQSVKVTIMGRFESSKRVKSGETTLQYVEDHNATAGRKGQLAIPDSFSLAIPVFEGRDPYRVTCRFRYRIQDGALLLGYVIDRPEDVLRMAVSEVVDEIREGWDGPLFVGRPQ